MSHGGGKLMMSGAGTHWNEIIPMCHKLCCVDIGIDIDGAPKSSLALFWHWREIILVLPVCGSNPNSLLLSFGIGLTFICAKRSNCCFRNQAWLAANLSCILYKVVAVAAELDGVSSHIHSALHHCTCPHGLVCSKVLTNQT